MKYSLNQIQAIIGGKIIGDGDTLITGIASVELAKEGDITFIKNDSLVSYAVSSQASAIVTPREIPSIKKPQIAVENPFMAVTRFMGVIAGERYARPPGTHPTAVISKQAVVGEGCSIGAYVVIDDGVKLGNNVVVYPHAFIGKGSCIGDGSVIHANVTIREDVTCGRRVVIHPNSVIGDDGFGYLPVEGRHVKIPQIGSVEIGDDAEIGAMVTICRAALDKTVIGNGVKIDNHSHIAHNVTIGDNSMLIAYAKIAGSARIGKNVMIAEDVGVTDHATIGDNCIIGGGSNVYKSLEPGSIVWGSPAKSINDEKRVQVLIKKLPEMYNTIKKLAKNNPAK